MILNHRHVFFLLLGVSSALSADTTAPINATKPADATTNSNTKNVDASTSSTSTTTDKPAVTTTIAPTSLEKPVTATPSVAPTVATPAVATPEKPMETPDITCAYHIDTSTTTIPDTILSTWAEKATIQAFDYAYDNIDSKLISLKNCFTDDGYKSFQEALNKAGNVAIIKSQQMSVSAETTKSPVINVIGENQWRIELPIQVTYQNKTEKSIQQLSINLMVGRKSNGDLGIAQLIASPVSPISSETATSTNSTSKISPDKSN